MGVRRAVDMVLDASNAAKNAPMYTYGPLIHNPQVLDLLKEKKITVLDDIPEKGTGCVLIRAHGVPPEDEAALKKAGFTVIDATCPRVVKVQIIIDKYARQGYATIIIGDENHPEVRGLLGHTGGRGRALTSLEALSGLPVYEKAVIVAQTTQNTEFFDAVKDWCREYAPHYKIFDTICGSTQKRQAEIRALAKEHDAVVVIGGRQSGNTKRLAQIAGDTGKPSVHIEDESQLDYDILSSAKSIAITAGASTPNWIIKETCSRIEDHFRQKTTIKTMSERFVDFLLKTNILAALGAGCLTYSCSAVQEFNREFLHAAISMLYVLSMQIMNNLFMIKSDKYNNPQRAAFYSGNKAVLWVLAVVCGAAGLYLSSLTGYLSFLVLLAMSLLGLSYNLRIFSVFTKRSDGFRIKDIPGSKTILITLAWGTVTCLLPALNNQGSISAVAIVFLFAAGIVFARTAFFDTLAVQGDKITGRETLPVLIGEKKTFLLIEYILIFDMMVVMAAFFTGILAKTAFILAFMVLVMFLLIRFFKKAERISGLVKEFFIESSFLVSGLAIALI